MLETVSNPNRLSQSKVDLIPHLKLCPFEAAFRYEVDPTLAVVPTGSIRLGGERQPPTRACRERSVNSTSAKKAKRGRFEYRAV